MLLVVLGGERPLALCTPSLVRDLLVLVRVPSFRMVSLVVSVLRMERKASKQEEVGHPRLGLKKSSSCIKVAWQRVVSVVVPLGLEAKFGVVPATP